MEVWRRSEKGNAINVFLSFPDTFLFPILVNGSATHQVFEVETWRWGWVLLLLNRLCIFTKFSLSNLILFKRDHLSFPPPLALPFKVAQLLLITAAFSEWCLCPLKFLLQAFFIATLPQHKSGHVILPLMALIIMGITPPKFAAIVMSTLILKPLALPTFTHLSIQYLAHSVPLLYCLLLIMLFFLTATLFLFVVISTLGNARERNISQKCFRKISIYWEGQV